MAFLFQISGPKKTPKVLALEELTGSRDIATSYYLASDLSTLKGYAMRFALDVEPQYAKTCATTLSVQSLQGTSFIFEKQGYFASAESVSIQFSHTGTLHSGDMIQIGGMELKVFEAHDFPKKWVLYNGRSQFELSDGGHLLEINYDNSRQFSDEERKYWAPVVCGDGKERLGIEYPFTVSLRSEGGKEKLELSADKQAGLYGLWAEGRGAWLPFEITLSFPGHYDNDLSKASIKIIDNPTTFGSDEKVLLYSLDKNSDLRILISFSEPEPFVATAVSNPVYLGKDSGIQHPVLFKGEDGVWNSYIRTGNMPVFSIFRGSQKLTFPASLDLCAGTGAQTLNDLGYNLQLQLHDQKGTVLLSVSKEKNSSTGSIQPSKFVSMADFAFWKNGGFRFLTKDLSKQPGYSFAGIEYIKTQSELSLFFPDQSKSQFHWTAVNSFQPYKDWEWNQLEYKGKGVGEQFTIDPVMYPNPAKEYSSIEFNWPGDRAYVELSLYDMAGRLVKPVFSGPLDSGQFRQIFDVRDLLAGSYLVQGSIISFDPKWERHPIGGQGALFKVVR